MDFFEGFEFWIYLCIFAFVCLTYQKAGIANVLKRYPLKKIQKIRADKEGEVKALNRVKVVKSTVQGLSWKVYLR